MPNTLKVSQSNVICGLGTWTHTVALTQMYNVLVRCTEHQGSAISIVIQLNGVTQATSTAPSQPQRAINISQLLNCTAGDVISVILSSSAAVDQQLNNVKTNIIVRQGQ